MERRFPPWLRKRIPAHPHTVKTRRILKSYGVNTVCQSARCPNLGECFAQDTATFMLLGNICTRDCRFCAVEKGPLLPPEGDEPDRVARAAQELGLKHVVLTSVTRDDLTHGGAEHFAATIGAVKERIPGVVVEVLTPDFQGDEKALEMVVQAAPQVFNHNVETVPRLYPTVRPQASYSRSLALLKKVKELQEGIYSKSGFMVGLGEEKGEVFSLLTDLRSVHCDLVTIGQYLQPTREHLPVEEFVPPHVFHEYREWAQELGFLHVSSGPLVRSSFHAADSLSLSSQATQGKDLQAFGCDGQGEEFP